MKNRSSWCALTLALSVAAAQAQEHPDTRAYARARLAVEDLERIVAPGGVQDSYKTKIGGIEQWISVRGQDRANPIILFVHGGPASPAMPSHWQFQRAWEEYFTVVHYDQRGAGKTHRGRGRAAVHEQDHRVVAVLAADVDPLRDAADPCAVGFLDSARRDDALQVADDAARLPVGVAGRTFGRHRGRRGRRGQREQQREDFPDHRCTSA